MSKSRALAGLRVGYAFGSIELIKCLNDVKFSVNSYTLSHPAILGGTAALRDEGYFRDTIKKIKATRQSAMERFHELGFSALPSDANFIFVKHEKESARKIAQNLKNRNIYVRHFDKDRIRDYLRVTIGTDEEMEILFGALKEIL